MYYLIHETSLSSLELILKSGYIFTSGKTQTIKETKGQGSKKRRLATNPATSLLDSEFYEHYDEVDGVYMRLQSKTDSVRLKFVDCIMLFNMSLLKTNRFVINTEENFGFMIDEEGVVNESQFSGEPGFSITSLSNLYLLNDLINAPASEVLLLDDVSILYLRTIFFNKLPPQKIIDYLQKIRVPFFNIS
ncbi:PrGVORF29 [Pieris rapae granulovirus Wuhan]|uniref:PrGVORF29 n=2 Tax=Betabaculovirus arrapae TaxID=362830 RepID=D2J4J6_9BBAC|nr:PrGVORF29 [Betabaculovirus arrapae]ACZ63515.1 PrGVORF29 [Betabaculovirus arrapae]AGS18792.1 hypothetical protein [Pieris rapae granulovirus]UOS85703.1 ORF29 [Pieris rapae granulovirus]